MKQFVKDKISEFIRLIIRWISFWITKALDDAFGIYACCIAVGLLMRAWQPALDAPGGSTLPSNFYENQCQRGERKCTCFLECSLIKTAGQNSTKIHEKHSRLIGGKKHYLWTLAIMTE